MSRAGTARQFFLEVEQFACRLLHRQESRESLLMFTAAGYMDDGMLMATLL
jgi:hypothetical protein